MRSLFNAILFFLFLMLPLMVGAKETYTTKYYYHWEKKEGTPHPEDVILALDYKADKSLGIVRIYCTTDEDRNHRRMGFLPGFYVLVDKIFEQDKVSDHEYKLQFDPLGKMTYAHPVEVKYKDVDDPWKSGKYKTWRYTSKIHPEKFKYKLLLEKDGTITLKGQYYKDRKFVPMSEKEVLSLNRNTYDAKQLAANRAVNPVDDERVKKASAIVRRNVQRTLRKDGKVYYEGEVSLFKNGQVLPEGKGKYIMSNGTVYEGDFVKGKWHGKGTIVWGDSTKWAGERYEGEWVEGRRTGQGTYTDAKGNVFKGRWEKNILVEPENQSPEVSMGTNFSLADMNLLDDFAMKEKLQIDYKKVEEFVTQNVQAYDELMKMFHASPMSLTDEEVAMLYYGFAFTKDYNPDQTDMLLEPSKLIKEGKYQEALELCEKELQKAPVSFSLLLKAVTLSGQLYCPDFAKYVQKAARIMDAIMLSGTGYSQENAIKVIYISDEYAIFRDIMKFKLTQQDFIESRYDRMTLETGNKGESIILWFDTNLSQQWRKRKVKAQGSMLNVYSCDEMFNEG